MSLILSVLIIPVALGIGGAFTPCALGINSVFLGVVAGRPRARRIRDWMLFSASRAALLTLLGLAFGLLGQTLEVYAWRYQMAINVGLILLGIVFIVQRFRPLPLPGFSLLGSKALSGDLGILGLGAVFGLDISACVGPLVLGLLAETVLLGQWWLGGVTLFVFGVGLSLPLLAATFFEKANNWLVEVARRHRTTFYLVAGSLLILLGAGELILSFAGQYTV